MFAAVHKTEPIPLQAKVCRRGFIGKFRLRRERLGLTEDGALRPQSRSGLGKGLAVESANWSAFPLRKDSISSN